MSSSVCTVTITAVYTQQKSKCVLCRFVIAAHTERTMYICNPSVMKMEKYRDHCALYANKPPMYGNDSYMFRSSSLRAIQPPTETTDEDAQDAYI